MKIIFLLPCLEICGGIRVVFEYANRLKVRGHKVLIFYPLFPLNFGEKWINLRMHIHKIRIFFDNLRKGNKIDWFNVEVPVIGIPSLSERYIPDGDVVIATAWPTAYYVNRYHFKKGRKVYFIQHYEVVMGVESLVNETYKFNLHQLVIASWLKELMIEKFNKKEPYLVPNGVNLGQFYNGNKIYNKNKRILMLYSLYEWKGAKDGIKAFELARTKHSGIKLVLFGTHKDKDIPLYAEFHLAPQGEDLRKLYCSCDIFLFPSWTEGWGLPPMEAMACKCAVVATNVGGILYYTIPGKTALISSPKEPEALAKNLLSLLDDEEKLKRISEEGYNYIKQFTWEKSTEQFERALNEIIAEKC
ncbi:MAG: glycosyltransferase family 4 protein [Candidatus Omnitrophica bacterium]|nr:glycosyltransferase family 4 protein [Candidatus Omnitrophota bacterium]MBU4478287.1 glycosyltransferase family 4 protein [Candidatus Omnitrophota bacterium]MCG2703355.1 glycosyltransferase family 4 protein [Candidatus Omnitrophota bacterium]